MTGCGGDSLERGHLVRLLSPTPQLLETEAKAKTMGVVKRVKSFTNEGSQVSKIKEVTMGSKDPSSRGDFCLLKGTEVMWATIPSSSAWQLGPKVFDSESKPRRTVA